MTGDRGAVGMGGEESTLLGGGKKCIGPEQMERMRPLDRRLMDGLLLGLCLPDRCAVVCMCYVYILALQLCVSLASCLQLLICVPHGISMSGLCPAQSVVFFFFFSFLKKKPFAILKDILMYLFGCTGS